MCYLPPFFYSWSPKGQLVAHIHDHMQSVNKYGTLFYSVNGLYLLCLLFLHRLCVLPDSTLFASFSDDCTVKLWDVQKMDGLHVINKPRLTYTLDGQLFILFFIYSFFLSHTGSVKSGCFCLSNQSIASASTDGSIHVHR